MIAALWLWAEQGLAVQWGSLDDAQGGCPNLLSRAGLVGIPSSRGAGVPWAHCLSEAAVGLFSKAHLRLHSCLELLARRWPLPGPQLWRTALQERCHAQVASLCSSVHASVLVSWPACGWAGLCPQPCRAGVVRKCSVPVQQWVVKEVV